MSNVPRKSPFSFRTGRVLTRKSRADGLLATCIQHELDHLNGKLFIDYLSKLKRDRVVKKFTKQAKLAGKI